MKKAVFLDRDGIINNIIVRDNNPFSPRSFGEFELIHGIEVPLYSFRGRGFLNIIVTNQPDVSRRLLPIDELNKMHALIIERLPVDDIMICPHDDADNCNCRKPKAGMLVYAAEKWDINIKESYLVGDSWRDIEAGKAVGCKTILLDMPYNQEVRSDHRVIDLMGAMALVEHWIVNHESIQE